MVRYYMGLTKLTDPISLFAHTMISKRVIQEYVNEDTSNSRLYKYVDVADLAMYLGANIVGTPLTMKAILKGRTVEINGMTKRQFFVKIRSELGQNPNDFLSKKMTDLTPTEMAFVDKYDIECLFAPERKKRFEYSLLYNRQEGIYLSTIKYRNTYTGKYVDYKSMIYKGIMNITPIPVHHTRYLVENILNRLFSTFDLQSIKVYTPLRIRVSVGVITFAGEYYLSDRLQSILKVKRMKYQLCEYTDKTKSTDVIVPTVDVCRVCGTLYETNHICINKRIPIVNFSTFY